MQFKAVVMYFIYLNEIRKHEFKRYPRRQSEAYLQHKVGEEVGSGTVAQIGRVRRPLEHHDIAPGKRRLVPTHPTVHEMRGRTHSSQGYGKAGAGGMW